MFVFVLPTQDHYCPKNNELVIDCVVRGRPKPTIKWFKNMAPLGIFPDDRLTVHHHHDENLETITTSVTIYAPNYGDKGKYECLIENEVGSNRLAHNVCYGTEEEFFKIINDREKQKEIEKAMELRKQRKLEEEAKRKAAEKEAAERKAKEEEEAKQAAEKAAKDAAKAAAKAAKAALKALKKNGGVPPPKTEMELAHEAVELRKKFDFVGRLRNRQVPVNKPTHLSCVVKCPEKYEVEWYKNGNKLANGLRISHQMTLEGGCYLEFERTRLTDTATYRCTVVSPTYGEVSCECEMEVYSIKSGDLEPTFTRHLIGKMLKFGGIFKKLQFLFLYLFRNTSANQE
jgi:Immunoglobulin I-set domain